jgi:undecaprenyl-diphosphatase
LKSESEIKPAGGETPERAGLDRRLFVALRTKWHFQPLEMVLRVLSQSGNWGLFWLGLAFVFFVGVAPNGRAMAVFMPITVWGTLIVNYAIKSILQRERPVAREAELAPLVGVPSSKSFPSSHAAMSFAAATVFTYFHPSLWFLFYALAFIIAWTRVYVGVHYPSDVLAGMLVGLAMGGLAALFLGWL